MDIKPIATTCNTTLEVQAVVEALHRVLGEPLTPISLHEPRFGGNEWAYVKDCLDTGWVSSVGAYVDRFEQALAEVTGATRAIAVVNGTAALHVALMLAGVKPGEEVLVPALTFVATANAVVYCGAVPHFVDSERRTLGLDPSKLADYLGDIAESSPEGCRNRATGRLIRAALPMHTFGCPVDLDPLLECCARHGIVVVEDAAESLGSYYKGRHTGTLSGLGTLSFNGNKLVTTGGGGAILVNDAELGRRAKHLTTTARQPHRWSFYHDQVGYNYRLPNLNAALGCAQLEQLAGFLESKRALACRYAQAFQQVAGVSVFVEPEFARSNYWLNVLLLDEEFSEERDAVLEQTNQSGFLTRPSWTLMHKLPMYAGCPRMDLSVAESLERRIINLPSTAGLGNTSA
jgi:perosamine synthetase